jgi:hypothetical protein
MKAAVAALVVAACAPLVFAGDSRAITVRREVTLQGQAIPPGDYKLVWSGGAGQGPGEIELRVQHGRKVVARATATRARLDAPNSSDSLVYRAAADGLDELCEVRFAGSREVLRVAPNAQARN